MEESSHVRLAPSALPFAEFLSLPENTDRGQSRSMPLSGEAIRMMNLVDDMATTMRRILALVPTLAPDERKRVADYLSKSEPGVDAVQQALAAK
jgi:hypothetical protein